MSKEREVGEFGTNGKNRGEERQRMTTDDLFEKFKREDDKQLEERHNYKLDFTSSKEQEKLEHHDRQRLRTGHLEEEEEKEDIK